MPPQAIITASEQTQIGEARRVVEQVARDAGLSETERGNAAICATELATNLVRHASNGRLLVQAIKLGGAPHIEILSVDSGPGMTSVAQCLEDGFSSAGTSGQGLGAVRRLSTEFDIFSRQPGGTVIVSRVGSGALNRHVRDGIHCGAVCQPAPGETVSGDEWRLELTHSGGTLMIADGLGHGPDAAHASAIACKILGDKMSYAPRELLEGAHQALMGTRGAAVAIAQVDMAARTVRYGGVGNIDSRLIDGGATRGLVSHNGTLGVLARRFQEFEYPWPERGLLVMHSDGLQSRWSLESYFELAQLHPSIVAAVLWRDFTRGRDDVTVVVVRINEERI